MLKVAVLVSGGGTNLQAILDAIDSGRITNAEVSLVISNNPNAYALERAKNHGIEAVCISPKEFENREEFHKALLKKLQESGAELIVLAGYLVAIPPMIVEAFPNKSINIHLLQWCCYEWTLRCTNTIGYVFLTDGCYACCNINISKRILPMVIILDHLRF